MTVAFEAGSGAEDASGRADIEVLVGSPPLPRQCARCRMTFPGDARRDAPAQPTWWLCPPCRTALLGDGTRSPR
jgi:hypothetical protein